MKRQDDSMSTLINIRNSGAKTYGSSVWDRIKLFLPHTMFAEIQNTMLEIKKEDARADVEEIRIRSGRRVCLTVGCRGGRRNLFLSMVTYEDELLKILSEMCDGSLYAYSDSIIRGYVSLAGGIRVGVCGHASVEGGNILGVRNISALNVRIPRGIEAVDVRVHKTIYEHARIGEGTLIYSPPAQGKTTLLRALAYSLSKDMRVALVDTREEFSGCFESKDLAIDILSGYPKAEGIRIATAFMSPELIICDEIGAEEAEAIAESQNCGVPLLASTHGSACEDILRRSGMRILHKAGVFGLYLGIRICYGKGFEYKFQKKGDLCFGDMGDNSCSP